MVNTKKLIFLPVLLLLFQSCEKVVKNPETKTKTFEVKRDTTTMTYEMAQMNDSNLKKLPVLKVVFSLDKNGLKVRSNPDNSAETLKVINYGEKIEVLEDLGEWLAIREGIFRKYTTEKNWTAEGSYIEKVYVRKDLTGNFNAIKLSNGDLNIVTSLVNGKKSEYYEKGSPLKYNLKIELIDGQTFNNKQKSAVQFLVNDSASIIKKNGITILPSINKTVKLKDHITDGDNTAEYNYAGQIPQLNKYLINGSYYESSDYFFIDKTSGERTMDFNGFPFLSPDQKYIISIYANPYDSTGELELYDNVNKKATMIMNTSFKNWMPTEDISKIFWCDDGFLYLAINHVKVYWQEDGNLNTKYQYIRIKIL